MTNRRQIASFAIAAGLLLSCLSMPALAQNARPCSVGSIAGAWVFATGIGQQAFPNFPSDGDITAIGTMNIGKDGSVEGVFDNNFAEFMAFTNNTYSGSVTVTPDCLGELTFVTSSGITRVDTIAIVSRDEFLGMSRDPNNLWTYQVRRISRAAGPASLSAKVDAILQRLGLVPSAFEEDDD